jgi:flagellar basal body-associated protein FliL
LGALLKSFKIVTGLGILFIWVVGLAAYYFLIPLELSFTDRNWVMILMAIFIVASVLYVVITIKKVFSIEDIVAALFKGLILLVMMSILIISVLAVAIVTFMVIPGFEPDVVLKHTDSLIVMSVMALIFSFVCTPKGSFTICYKSIANQGTGLSKSELNQAVIFISIFGNITAFISVIFSVMGIVILLSDLSDGEIFGPNFSNSLIPCLLGFIVKFVSYGFQLKYEYYLLKIDQLELTENYRQYRKKTRPSLIALILTILASIALGIFLILPDQKMDSSYEESLETEYLSKNKEAGREFDIEAVAEGDGLEFLFKNYQYFEQREYIVNPQEPRYYLKISIAIFFSDEIGLTYLSNRFPYVDDLIMDFFRGISINDIKTISQKEKIEKELNKMLNSLYSQDFLEEAEYIPPVKFTKIQSISFY